MIDMIVELISSAKTSVLVTVVLGVLFSILSYFISPILFRYILKYISTDSIDFNQGRFIGNSQWAISTSFLLSVVILTVREYSLFLSIDAVIESISLTIITILWLRVIHNLGQYAIKRIVAIRYDQSIIPIIENVWTFVIFIGTTFLIFDVWSIDLTPLLASAGIAGVVLGLAAREMISNFFGSIALYADNTYEKGDYIELNNGDVHGYVNDISIRSTQIITLAGNKVVIPNSKLHNSIVKNKSSPNKEYRTILRVGVSYDSDPELAKRSIRTAVEQVIESEESYRRSWFFGGTDSYKVFVDEFDDSAVVFKVFAKVSRPEDEPRIRSRLYQSIYDELEEVGIEIPFPQRSIHFKDNDDSTEGLIQKSEE